MSDRMPPDDEYPSLGREREQAEASENRLRKLIARVQKEARDEFWLRQGFDVSTPEGFARLQKTLALASSIGIDVMDSASVKDVREALPWAIRAQKRAATFGTRLLAWISGAIGIVLGMMGIVKYLQDWRGH